ncbi:MAG: FkbM family methyltransferase [Solirubrobacterales bacterium]
MGFLGKHPRVRGVLRGIRRIVRPVSSLRQQGRDQVYRNLHLRFKADPLVALPEFEGEFVLDVRSDVLKRLLMKGHYEPGVAACCRRFLRPDRDAVDVGANVGFYSVLFAKRISPGRRVLAVEPIPEAVAKLKLNLQRNGVTERVLIHEGAASDEEGPCDLTTVDGKSEYSTLGRLAHASVATAVGRAVSVPGICLDALVQQRILDPGFLKIDVEGAELKVLRGATRLLEEKRPNILIEVHRYLLEEAGDSANQVLEFLREHGYGLFNPERPDRPPVQKDCFPVLCLPGGRSSHSA